MRFHKSILFAAALSLLPLASQARSIKSDPTLSVDGMTFNDFSCTVAKGGSAGPNTCGPIHVSTVTQPGDGLRFSSEFKASSFGSVSFDDATINYHVSSKTGIDAIGLDFDGAFYGYAISSVTESIYNSDGQQVGFARVVCGTEPGCSYWDAMSLDGRYKDLWVKQDIDVASFVGGANIGYIDDVFNNATAPEPASIGLVGASLLGVAILGRRRIKAVTKA
jgi:hypothetical protein